MFFKQITYGKKYACIEHTNNKTFHILQLVKKKSEFVVSKKETATSINSVFPILKGQKHLFLIVNDEQVLSKKVPINTIDTVTVIRTAYPNILINDFYYEIYSVKSESFISIIRKEVIDNLIEEYKKEGISVIDFSLGNIVVKNLQNFISNKTIFSSNSRIHFGENTLIGIEKATTEKKSYTINNLKILNTYVLSLSGIIAYYTNNLSNKRSQELREYYLQKRYFNIVLKTCLTILSVILMVNFFFFNNYRAKVVSLTGELQLTETYKIQLNRVKEEVQQKKQLLRSVNLASNSKLSKYIDDLGFSVPNTILLSQIEYQPKLGIQKNSKKIVFNKNIIVLTGDSKSHEKFSKWVSFLEKIDWIKNVSIKEYGKGKKINEIANFELIITIDD